MRLWGLWSGGVAAAAGGPKGRGEGGLRPSPPSFPPRTGCPSASFPPSLPLLLSQLAHTHTHALARFVPSPAVSASALVIFHNKRRLGKVVVAAMLLTPRRLAAGATALLAASGALAAEVAGAEGATAAPLAPAERTCPAPAGSEPALHRRVNLTDFWLFSAQICFFPPK